MTSIIGDYRRWFVRTLGIHGRKAKRMAVATARMAKDLESISQPPEKAVESIRRALASENEILKRMGEL